MTVQSDVSDRTIISSRVLNASPATVFNAFKTPELLALWWGPEGFTNTFSQFDFMPGGTWDFIMHGPNGVDYPNTNHFVEIIENERVVFDHVLAPVFRMTITFDAVENPNQTRFGFHMVFESAQVCASVKAMCGPANEQNFDRLEAVLARS